MPNLRDPDEFLDAARNCTDLERARVWKRAVLVSYFPKISDSLLDAAFGSLTSWESSETAFQDQTLQLGIEGAFAVIRQRMTESPQQADELARRMASYFSSPNYYLAFAAVRQFDVFLGHHTQHVERALFELAVGNHVISVPGPMSLRAIAFKVLFQLNPDCAKQAELNQAKEECVSGCVAWASESGDTPTGNRFRELAARIIGHSGA